MGRTGVSRSHPPVPRGERWVTGNGLFVAAGVHAVATNQDGITWTNRTNPTASSDWRAIAYQNGIFVAVGDSGDGGTGNRGMYSGTFTSASPAVTGVSPASDQPSAEHPSQ